MQKFLQKSIESYLEGKSKAYSKIYMLFLEFWTFYFKQQGKKYIESLDSMLELKKTGEKSEFIDEINALLTEVYLLGQTEELVRIENNLASYGYKMPENMAISSERAKEYAENHSAELIKWIDETTKNEISAIVSMGIMGGQTKFQIAEKIKETFESFSLYRANLITHMEMATAYSTASRHTNDVLTDKLGVIGWKRALTQKDDNVRASHKENEKVGWIPKNQDYPYVTLNPMPPFDFNCRCSESYSAVNPNTGKLYETDEYLWSPFKIIADEVKLNSLDEDVEEKVMLLVQKMFLKTPDIPKFSAIIDVSDVGNLMEYHYKKHALWINSLLIEKMPDSRIFSTIAHEFWHVVEYFYKKNDEKLFNEIKLTTRDFWENFILHQKVDDTKFWYPLSIRDWEYYEHITKDDERYDIILQEVFAESSKFYILWEYQFLNQEMIDLFSKIYK